MSISLEYLSAVIIVLTRWETRFDSLSLNSEWFLLKGTSEDILA
jgi:hypothetical protein